MAFETYEIRGGKVEEKDGNRGLPVTLEKPVKGDHHPDDVKTKEEKSGNSVDKVGGDGGAGGAREETGAA